MIAAPRDQFQELFLSKRGDAHVGKADAQPGNVVVADREY
jgi:hypothetical protein